MFCSVESKRGLDSLAFSLRNQTTVVMGPSGVGKSRLINALRNNPRAYDAAGVDNLFDSVGLMSLLFIFILLCFLLCLMCRTVSFVHVLLPETRKQEV